MAEESSPHLTPTPNDEASHDEPLGSFNGYLFTVVGGTLGAVLGYGIGFLLVSRIKGDPPAGMANIALISAAFLLITLLGVAGVPAGAYLALRLGGAAYAGKTALMLALLISPVGWMITTGQLFSFPFAWLAILVAGGAVARLLAIRLSTGRVIDRVAVVGLVGLVWLLAVFPSTRSYSDRQESRLKATSFQLFEASQLPSGQQLHLIYTNNDTDPPWVKLEYGKGGSFFILIEYPDFGRFHPPTDCGPSSPDSSEIELDQECQKVYTTSHGHDVFLAPQNSMAYLRIGSTMITTSWGQNGVRQILDSLKPVDRDTLLEKVR